METPLRERKIDRNLWILILVFVILTLGILLAGWFYYQGQVKTQRQKMEYQLAALADMKVREINRWKRERFGEAHVLFNHLSFSKLVKRFFEGPDDAGVQKELWSWLNQVRIGRDFEALFLIDDQERVRMTVPGQSHEVCPTLKKELSRALKSGELTLVDIHREGEDRPPLLGMIMPIRDLQGRGRIIGLLVLRVDPDGFLYPLLKSWPTPHRTAEAQLVRREGEEVVFLSPLRFQKNAVLNLRLPLSRTEVPAVQAALGREGVVEGKALRGVPVLAALRGVPETPWFLVAKLDLEEVYAPLRERLEIVITFVCLLILALGASLGLVWRHQRSVYYREKFQAAETLRRQERQLALMADHFPGLMAHIDRDLRYLFVNARYEQVFGKRDGGWVGRTVPEALGPEGFKRVAPFIQRALEGETVTLENPVRTADGGVFVGHFTFIPDRDSEGKVIGYYLFGMDITDLKRTQEELQRMNRLFGALSQVNQVVVRVESREELFKAVCRIMVKDGGFRLAWVGRLSPKKDEIEVAAYAGHDGGFLDGMKLCLPDPSGRLGAVSVAIKDGRTFLSTDFQNTVWEEAARICGFRALIALPLKNKGEVQAVLVIHEESHDFFRIKEINLLEEVAGDVSFALDHLAREEERKRIEEELRLSEEKYRDLVESSLDLICTHDLEGNLLSVNETAVRLSGYTKERLLTMNLRDLLDPEVRPLFGAYLKTIAEKGYARGFMRTRDAKGHLRILDFQNTLRKDVHPYIVRGTAHDVTERFLAEEKLKETMKHLEQAVETTIRVMASAVEARDPYTAGHQRRTMTIAEAIARETGLPEERIAGLRLAAAIHDLGKLSIPAEILSKPTTLTPIEFALIKTHPQNGYEILKDIQSPWPLAEIVYQHHERMNGSGYPRGLQGEAILPEARILAVADVVEAIASHRPYRPAFGLETALKEIEKEKGVLFDPEVVEVCLRLFREKGFRLE